MDDLSVLKLGLISHVNAEIEAMKCTNHERKENNLALAYNENHFQEKADQLLNIVWSNSENINLI